MEIETEIEFIDSLNLNTHDPECKSLLVKLSNDRTSIENLHDFLVDQKRIPSNSNYGSDIIQNKSSTLSALWGLVKADKSKEEQLFKKIVIAYETKFSTCNTICLYINRNRWCGGTRDFFKKYMENNTYCRYYEESINKSKDTNKKRLIQLLADTENRGIKTILELGIYLKYNKIKIERELNNYNKSNIGKLSIFRNILFVLRRFNSYTPLLNYNTLVGGGYFFWSGNKGIVIDPGIDFIKNFLAAGFHIDMIDKVIVTHAHPDHIADVPSIITLLHEQNEYIKKSSRINKSTVYEDIYEIKVPELKKRIDIYLNPSAYKYLDGILAIDNTKANYDLHMIDANMIDRNILDDIELCTLPTIHEDCLSKDLGVGIILRSQKQNFQIIYTSDTSINEDLIDRYKVKLSKNKFNTVMIGNIGGVHQNELNALIHFEENRGQVGILTKEFRYPNHLGIIGFVTLINRLKTIININTVIIGEIGLEMQNVKVTLSEKIGEEVNIPTIISDLGLSIDVESNSIYALDIDGTHKLLPTTNVSSLLTQNGDCIYVSKELNEEDINKAQYQDNQKAWFKNIPILW